jgi:hypothetical protein
LVDLIPQKTLHKKQADGVAQGVAPEFKPQYQKKKKNLLISHDLGGLF